MSSGIADTSPEKLANKRGVARLAAVQALYQLDLSRAPVTEVVEEYENFRIGQELDGDTYLDADKSWFRGIVTGVAAEQKQLDPMIHKTLPKDWPLSRIDTLLRSLIRAAVFELLKRPDVPAAVVISEYLDIANAFFDDDEPRLVNGVLDTIARQLRSGELSESRDSEQSG